ncbi:hypothetical protein [uncultured Litoreibacter sp.]|uniref:hypothetical protein n=1 Tax=uncultured Litoreibacter sp. TaxID=1392394 RepID=UPI0026306868|nr:hypothetical protein [uncultured Litoreibacter sp.]
MKDEILSAKLNTLIGLFNVNVALADEVPDFVKGLSAKDQAALREEYLDHLENDRLNEEAFNLATSCTARSREMAQIFFEKVFKYAFEEGEEPEVTQYWNR